MIELLWQSIVLSTMALRLALLAPFLSARFVYRGVRRLAGASSLMSRDAFACGSCGNAVSIVGRWRCGRCGYVFDGFGFARCAVCRAVPPYLPCNVCGAGLRNPTYVGHLNR